MTGSNFTPFKNLYFQKLGIQKSQRFIVNFMALVICYIYSTITIVVGHTASLVFSTCRSTTNSNEMMHVDSCRNQCLIFYNFTSIFSARLDEQLCEYLSFCFFVLHICLYFVLTTFIILIYLDTFPCVLYFI